MPWLRFRRVLVGHDVAPKPAQNFAWTRVGGDVSLEVGHFDMPELREAVEKAKALEKGGGAPTEADAVEVTLFVTDRFVLTPQGVSSLAESIKSLLADLEKEGLLQDPSEVKH